MSPPHQVPAYLRYLKARLEPFRRPTFWLSTIGLLLVLLVAWEYWDDPNWLSTIWGNQVSGSDNQDTTPELSSKELAARLADIDSSSVLLKEFDPTTALPLAPIPNQESQNSNSQGLRQQGQANSRQEQKNSTQTGTSQPTVNSSNPFATSVQEFLNIGSVSGGSLIPNPQTANRESSSSRAGATADPTLGFNSLNSLNTNQGTAAVSPLQDALNRVAAATPSPAANQTQTPANAQSQALPASNAQGYQGQLSYPPTTSTVTVPGATGYNAAGQLTYPSMTVPGAAGYNTYPITPTAPQNSYTYLTPSQPLTGIPATVPMAPVAPGIPGNYGSYPNQPPGQPYGVSNPGFNSIQGNPGLQPSQLSQPTYTTPRPIPGRYVGGGQINTFSNP